MVKGEVKELMGYVCDLSMQDEIERIERLDASKIDYKELSQEQIDELAEKILLLPFDLSKVLFFRYCFNNTASEIDKIFEAENSEGELLYIHKMLSVLMKIGDYWIDYKSLKEACNLALIKDVEEYNDVEIKLRPNYSKKFRGSLKDIKTNRKNVSTLTHIVNRIAVLILIIIMGFSTVLTVSAGSRTKFVDWIVETFPKFTIFTSEIVEDEAVSMDLTSFNIGYIPPGFKLEDVYEGHIMLIYNYYADYDQWITIKFISPSSKGRTYYDQEGVDIEEIILKESKAYIWQTDKLVNLILSQDGIECHISGNVKKEAILKIAESISK